MANEKVILKIICIKADNGVFISSNIEGKSYYGSGYLNTYYFDGEQPEKTFRSDWFKVLKVPEKVQKMGQTKYENVRWELKKGYPVSEMTPSVLDYSPHNEESDYYEICNLYEMKRDELPSELEDVEFELNLVEGGKFIKENFTVKYGLLDQLTVLPVMLPNRPCSISGEDLYRMIRNRVNREIDNHYARVTSNYDFCFTVQKVIKLADPEPYKQDIGTKRKPHVITKYRNERTITVFQSAPKAYQSYTVQQGIVANNYEELEEKVETYISDLIKEINKPLQDCPHCKGLGVINI